MLETIGQLIPIALAGAFLPTWTLFVIVFLGSSRPLVNAGSFVAGNGAFRLTLGAFVLFGPVTVSVPRQVGALGAPLAAAAFALAALGLGTLAVREFARRGAPSAPLPAWLARIEGASPLAYAAFGAAMVAGPGIQWAYFLAGTNVIATSEASAASQVALLVVFVLALEAMLLTPIIVYASAPERAATALGGMRSWLEHRQHAAASAILGGLALYCAWRAALAALALTPG